MAQAADGPSVEETHAAALTPIEQSELGDAFSLECTYDQNHARSSTERSDVVKVKDTCKPPEERSCANKCNGEYGMLCPFSTVCDPIKHRCEKAQP
jgi:hypothetical protein